MTHPPAVSTASATPAGEPPSPAKNPPPTPDSRPPTADHRPPTPGPRLLTPYSITLALLSGGGLMLEIALTRFFSTLFFPPYVFAVISIAILGLGLGAALATVRPAWRQLTHVTLYLTLAGYAVILLLLVAVWTASINLNGVLLALVLLPYLFIGLALATIFSAAPAASPRLYRADLLGAGVGAIGAIPVMNVLGGLNTLFLVSALFGLAALIVDYSANSAQRDRVLLSASEPEQPEQPPRRNRLAAWLLCGLAAVALITNTLPATRWLEIDMAALASAKPITESLAGGGAIIRTTWDSFARTDLVDPGQGRPYELYLDGAAGSVMPPAGDLNLLRTDIGFFPFATTQPEQVLVVGPGGGLDVWFALNGRAQEVTAVEINPASVGLVNELAAYHGDLYHQPGVRVLVDEGRSVLRREDRRYDLIYLSQVVTLAAERNGYALTENTIYTVEAFSDYLAHLQSSGQIALKLYDELTLTRALVTAATALRQTRGISEAEAMAHLAVFLDPNADPPVPLLIIQAEPFAPGDAQAYADVASRVGFTPLFVPGVTASPALAGVMNGQTSLADLIAASASDIAPTTDDRPFFYQFERGVPQRLRPLLWGMGGLLVGLLVGWFVGWRVGWFDGADGDKTARWMPIYFAALGAGFMMVEMALIQQTRLFLGHPTPAVTTILGVLLIGGGIGSGWAGRWPDAAKPGRLIGVLLVIVALVVVWLMVWPWVSGVFLAAPTGGRMVVATAGVLPLALLMGIPFPLGLWFAGRFDHGDRHVALAWAVNGVMTVAGSAAAVTLAMLAGFSWVLLAGAGMYGVAATVAYGLRGPSANRHPSG